MSEERSGENKFVNQYTIERLLQVAGHGMLKEVQQHLQNGVDINGANSLGRTALHWASRKGHVEVVNILLNNRAYASATDNSRETPLHMAANSGHYDVCLLLLQNGANVDIANKFNETAIDQATSKGYQQVVQLLHSYQKKKELLLTVLLKSLNEAKNQHGTLPVRFIKILLTGSGAAGKTSFSNLLMKKQFNSKHHSTNVVQCKHAISISCRQAVLVKSKQMQDQGVTWIEMDDSTLISHLRQVLLPPNTSVNIDQKGATLNESAELKSTKAASLTRQLSGSSIASRTQNFANRRRRWSFNDLGDWLSGFFQSSVKSENLTSFKTLVENTISEHTTDATKLTHHPGEVLNIITILDTGGQPEYIHLLPTVNVHPMITFIVHDLSRSLEDQVLVEYSEHGKHTFEPYHLQYSNLDMIKFLMSSINDSLERPLLQVPQLVTVPGKDTTSYLCCVGTHADKVDPGIVHKIDSKLANMVDKIKCKAAVWRNNDGGVLFPVDNTTSGGDNTEDPTAKTIRNEIETMSLNKNVYELPITWMFLELEIHQVCTGRGKPYISFQECVSIALQSNLITDVEQVRSALLYYHLLGVLLYYPEVPGLCDYIITDHQWLFDRLSQIVCFSLKKSLSNQWATNRLKHSGILSKELLQILQWEDDLKQDYFISLLVTMKIIAPISREDGEGKDYFIPYILPTYINEPTGEDILAQYGCLQGEPLLVQFVSNLLPRGFFCCLIVEVLQNLPSGWSHLITQEDACHAYSNLITFHLPHAYFLSLVDTLSYLEVQIRHEEKYYHEKCPIHLSIQDVLASALENVCDQLNFNHGRLQYGFHCQCGKSDDEHIAILTSLSPPFDYAQCSHGSVKSTNLQRSHIVWLSEEVKKFDETASVVSESKLAVKDHNDHNKNSPEFRIFQEYYSKLVDCLPAKELSHYLVSEGVITLMDNEDITSPATSSSRAAELLLSRVSLSLQEGNTVLFLSVLKIMQQHGNEAIASLSIEIQRLLNKSKGFQSAEYTVLLEFYSKLVDVLQVKSLTPYLIEGLVFTPQDGENVGTILSRKRAAEFLLAKISAPLKANFENCSASFYKLLEIAKQHGNADTMQLCGDITKRLTRIKLGSQVKRRIVRRESIV